MRRAEVDLAVEWAAAEGWNPGLHDAECFYAADPDGFFLCECEGVPVGCISAVAYNDTFGFIGFYIVRSEYRGHRFGIYLGREGLQYLGNRNIGLDGVIGKVENYKALGFQYAYRNARYEYTGSGVPSGDLNPLSEVPFEALLDYDRQCFPAPRRSFLEKWIQPSGGAGYAKMRGNSIRGYGVIRPCRIGYKIGPLFADDPDIAEEIFRALVARAKESLVFLDVPELNAPAVALAGRYEMKKVFETARMYSIESPDIRLDRIYGVTSFELG